MIKFNGVWNQKMCFNLNLKDMFENFGKNYAESKLGIILLNMYP